MAGGDVRPAAGTSMMGEGSSRTTRSSASGGNAAGKRRSSDHGKDCDGGDKKRGPAHPAPSPARGGDGGAEQPGVDVSIGVDVGHAGTVLILHMNLLAVHASATRRFPSFQYASVERMTMAPPYTRAGLGLEREGEGPRHCTSEASARHRRPKQSRHVPPPPAGL